MDQREHSWDLPMMQEFIHEDVKYIYPSDYIASISVTSLRKLCRLMDRLQGQAYVRMLVWFPPFCSLSRSRFPSISQVESMTNIPIGDITSIFAIEIRCQQVGLGDYFCRAEVPGLNVA